MDLGLLIIANLIMRTRLPPKPKGTKNASTIKEVLTDVPFLTFVLGSFMVSITTILQWLSVTLSILSDILGSFCPMYVLFS